jgi:hypothetical protein
MRRVAPGVPNPLERVYSLVLGGQSPTALKYSPGGHLFGFCEGLFAELSGVLK